jgi:mannan endo-1,4-beta-mannosidase
MGFGARNLWAASLPAGTTGPALLRDVLDSAAAAKFNVMRILSHGVNKESDMTLNGVAGKFNENVAKGLDYVVAEAGKRGIRSEK